MSALPRPPWRAGRTRTAGARRVTALTVVLLTVAGCGNGARSDGGSGGTSPGSASVSPRSGSVTEGADASGGRALSGTITVFAAASLRKTFTQIGAEVEDAHPGTTVRFSFAGSSDLAAQLLQGAPADVFASADTTTMAKAAAGALTLGAPVDFATNTVEIAVPPGNPAKVSSLADLAKPGVKVVLCAPVVPCGKAAVKVQTSAGVTIKPVSEEQSVTDVLGKVSAGEADAGLVYVTDVRGAGAAVRGVPFRESSSAVNTYPVAALKDTRNRALAQAFVAAVSGEPGRSILAAAGFGPPTTQQ
jgi:molybdate transport system substrate-binding protein